MSFFRTLKMFQDQNRNLLTAVFLLGITFGMIGLTFSSVTLYKLFCQVTGYGGTPKTETSQGKIKESANSINVRFDANINANLPWLFKPERRELSVILGKPKLAFYFAKNKSIAPIAGTATYNVTPFKAAKYFSKIDCFCFSQQTLEPGEKIPMPVEFVIDPEILKDPDTAEVKTITLSYTFFPVTQSKSDKRDQKINNHVARKL